MNDHVSTGILIDYLRGELGAERDAAVLAHLDACSACRSEYEAEASLGEMLRSAATREELEFPSIVKARVWEAVRSERPQPWAWLGALWRPAVAVPAAVAAAAALFFLSPLAHQGSGAPSIAAVYYLEAHAAQQAQNPLLERGPAASTLIEASAGNNDSTVPTQMVADDWNATAPVSLVH